MHCCTDTACHMLFMTGDIAFMPMLSWGGFYVCRNQTLPYAVTYPTQNVTTTEFGTWPIIYEGVDCPTGGHKLQYHIQNVSTVVSTFRNHLLKPPRSSHIHAAWQVMFLVKGGSKYCCSHLRNFVYAELRPMCVCCRLAPQAMSCVTTSLVHHVGLSRYVV